MSAPEERLGFHVVEEEVARTLCGRFVRARDTDLGVLSAIEILSPPIARDATLVKRFRDELRRARSADHPALSRPQDVIAQDDVTFVLGEWIDGESLATRLARGPLSVVEAVRTVRKVGEALAGWHRLGLVHRGLSLDVIVVRKDGFVVVTRPAIATPGEAQRRTGRVERPPYASPEALTPEPVTPAADVFALGAMLAALVVGTPPERGVREALSSTNPDAPPVLDDIVARCLAEDPAERPGDAGAVVEALLPIEALLGMSDPHAALAEGPPRPPPRPRGEDALPTRDGARDKNRITEPTHVMALPPHSTFSMDANVGGGLLPEMLVDELLMPRGRRGRPSATSEARAAEATEVTAAPPGDAPTSSATSAGAHDAELSSSTEVSRAAPPDDGLATAAADPTAQSPLPVSALGEPDAATAAVDARHVPRPITAVLADAPLADEDEPMLLAGDEVEPLDDDTSDDKGGDDGEATARSPAPLSSPLVAEPSAADGSASAPSSVSVATAVARDGASRDDASHDDAPRADAPSDAPPEVDALGRTDVVGMAVIDDAPAVRASAGDFMGPSGTTIEAPPSADDAGGAREAAPAVGTDVSRDFFDQTGGFTPALDDDEDDARAALPAAAGAARFADAFARLERLGLSRAQLAAVGGGALVLFVVIAAIALSGDDDETAAATSTSPVATTQLDDADAPGAKAPVADDEPADDRRGDDQPATDQPGADTTDDDKPADDTTGDDDPDEPAEVAPRPVDDDRTADANLAARIADERRAVGRAVQKRGLRQGDDATLDAHLAKSRARENAGDKKGALEELVAARRRAALVKIDASFVAKKLARAKALVDDIDKASAKKKASAHLARAEKELKKKKHTSAHVFVNRALKLVPDR